MAGPNEQQVAASTGGDYGGWNTGGVENLAINRIP